LTDNTPKPLVEVAGRPIIVHQFDWLKKYGVEEFIVTIGHLKERFLEVLGSGRKYGVHVSYVVEEEPLGTASGLKNARALVDREDAFYVLNGDVLTDIDPRRTLEVLDGEALGVVAFKAEALKLLYESFMESRELDIMSHLIPGLIGLGKPVNAYVTGCFWYDIGSTEKYEKLDHSLIDRLFEFEPYERLQ
jgi:NDP-sugar pyrophosphorylase family protein